MSRLRRIPRVLIAVAALCLGAIGGAPLAWGHVHASADNAVRGGMAIVTFSVPNESDSGAATTALSVALPNVASAATETLQGWTAQLDRDTASGTVRSVTWTAAPNAGIGVDQFALFRISVQLPDTDTVSFPATQTYADGKVVKWDQPPSSAGGEPEHPAPLLTLAAGSPEAHEHHPGSAMPAHPDNVARLLAGAALILGAVGIFLVLVRRRG